MNLQPFNFVKAPATSAYAEIGQTQHLHFCLAYQNDNQSFTKASEWFVCREFLNDWVAANSFKDPYTIYGFHAQKNTDDKYPLMLIKMNKTEKAFFNKNFELMLKFLEVYMPDSTLNFEEFENGYAIQLSDDIWNNQLLISFISWYLKCLTKTEYPDMGVFLDMIPESNEKNLGNMLDYNKFLKVLQIAYKTKPNVLKELLEHDYKASTHAFGFFRPLQFKAPSKYALYDNA